MKKIFLAMLLTCMLCLQMQMEAAPASTWKDDTFSLSSVHRLYLNSYKMNYEETKESPKVADIEAMFAEKAADGKYFAATTEDIKRLLLRDKNIDLDSLSPKEANAVLDANIGQYVDAYVVMTIVHNRRVVIFYDVYSAQTGKLVYSYQTIAGSYDDDNIKTYGSLTKNFYTDLAKAAKNELKKKK